MATYYSGYSNTYRLILELSETKLSDYINTNKTRVNYSLKCSCGSSYAQWNPGPGDFSISINGSVVKTLNNPSFFFPGTYSTITIASGYTDITHNNDGSKTVSFSASYKAESTAGYLPGNMSLSGNYALTTIPRATTISSVTSEVYVNGSNSISIALDRKSANFTQDVTIKANDTYQTTITNSDVNVSYVIPVTWINAIGSNTSISGTVSVTTYNGSTQIGDTQTSTFTLKKATPSTITCTDSIECNGSNILRVGITRQNTAFLHTVNFVFGSYSQSFSSIENLKEYAPPMTWLNAIPNATSGKGTVTVTTYYGSISLGSNFKEFELVVPTSVVPSISSFTSSVVNPSQMSSWGVYVQGYSQAKLTIGASGSYGSTISEWYFDGVSQISNTKTTEAINQSGTVTFKAKVKDSRGRTSSEEYVSISVNEYSTPVLIKNLLKRCLSDETIDDEGTYVLANFTFLYSSCAGKNSITTRIYSREITAESWTDNGTLTSGVNKKISSFDISKPYAIKVVSTDGVGNEATYVDVIETSNAIIDILKGGNGMGLGMMASKADTLQIGFPHIEVDNGIFYINYTDKTTGKTVKSQIGSQNGSYMHYLTDAENGNYFNKKVTVDNSLEVSGDIVLNGSSATVSSGIIQSFGKLLYPVGAIYITYGNTNPGTFLGGIWVQFGHGRVLMGQGEGNDGNTSMSFTDGSTGGEYNHTLTTNEMPSHNHTLYFDNGQVAKLWQISTRFESGSQSAIVSYGTSNNYPQIDNTGGGSSHNNMQPYITVYFWRRTS